MSFVQRSLLVTGVFFLCQLAAARADDGKEPEADGQPLSHWLKQLDDPDKRLEAVKKIKEITAESDFNAKGVVDRLIDSFKQEEKKLDDWSCLLTVIEALTEMKSKDEAKRAVIPALKKYKKVAEFRFKQKADEETETVFIVMTQCMVDFTKSVNCEGQLFEALNDKDPFVQGCAIRMLGMNYHHSKSAMDKLRTIARSDDKRLSEHAKEGLKIAQKENMQDEDDKKSESEDKPLSHWLKCLDDPETRLEAIGKIKEMTADSDANAKEVVDKLIGCFQKDEKDKADKMFLEAVLKTLAEMKSKDEAKRAVIPALRKYVRIKEIVFREKGNENPFEIMEVLRPTTEGLSNLIKNVNGEEQLLEALNDKDFAVQSNAIMLLGLCCHQSKTAIAKLKKIARSDNEPLSEDAKKALRIAEMLQDPNKFFKDIENK